MAIAGSRLCCAIYAGRWARTGCRGFDGPKSSSGHLTKGKLKYAKPKLTEPGISKVRLQGLGVGGFSRSPSSARSARMTFSTCSSNLVLSRCQSVKSRSTS